MKTALALPSFEKKNFTHHHILRCIFMHAIPRKDPSSHVPVLTQAQKPKTRIVRRFQGIMFYVLIKKRYNKEYRPLYLNT